MVGVYAAEGHEREVPKRERGRSAHGIITRRRSGDVACALGDEVFAGSVFSSWSSRQIFSSTTTIFFPPTNLYLVNSSEISFLPPHCIHRRPIHIPLTISVAVTFPHDQYADLTPEEPFHRPPECTTQVKLVLILPNHSMHTNLLKHEVGIAWNLVEGYVRLRLSY
jgi:hypothetical protein